jgi:hypothetical protein
MPANNDAFRQPTLTIQGVSPMCLLSVATFAKVCSVLIEGGFKYITLGIGEDVPNHRTILVITGCDENAQLTPNSATHAIEVLVIPDPSAEPEPEPGPKVIMPGDLREADPDAPAPEGDAPKVYMPGDGNGSD